MASGEEQINLKLDAKALQNGLKLPKWATETTLEEVNANLAALKNRFIKQSDEEKARSKTFETLFGKADRKAKEDVSKKKQQQKNQDSDHEKVRGHFHKLGISTHGVQNKFNLVSDIAGGVSGLFKSLFSPLGILSETVLGAGVIFEKLIKQIVDFDNVLVNLYDNGFAFQDNLNDLRHSAAEVIMPLDEFAKLIIKNSALFKSLGVKEFANIAVSVRKATEQQGMYGLSIEQLNGYTADYLELVRKQGNLTRMNAPQEAIAAENYIRSLTEFSQILGKSREEINKDIQESSTLPEIFATFYGKPQGAKDVYQAIIGEISGTFGGASKDLEKEFEANVIGPLGQIRPFMLALTHISPELANRFTNLAKSVGAGTISMSEAKKQFQVISNELGGLSSDQVHALAIQTGYGGALAEGSKQLESMIEEMQAAQQAALQQPNSFTEAMQLLKTVLAETFTTIKTLFGDLILSHVDDIKLFSDMLKQKLVTAMDLIGDLIDPTKRDQAITRIEEGLKNTLSQILDFIAVYIKDYIDVLLGRTTQQQINEKRNRESLSTKLTPEDKQTVDAAFNKFKKEGFYHPETTGITEASKLLRQKYGIDPENYYGVNTINALGKPESQVFRKTENVNAAYGLKYLDTSSLDSPLASPVLQSPTFAASDIDTSLQNNGPSGLLTDALNDHNDKLDQLVNLMQQNNDYTASANTLLKTGNDWVLDNTDAIKNANSNFVR